MANTNPRQRVVIGAFILIIGLLALIDKLNIFESLHFFQFWPTVFIAVGVLKILHSKGRSSILIGGGLIFLGVVLTLKHLGLWNINLWDWWPAALIAVGAYIMFKDKRQDTTGSLAIGSGEQGSSDSACLDISVVMGGNKTVSNAQDFKGGDITAVMGGVELDLRGASMQADAVLNLWATWGGIVIKVPADWSIVNRGTALMGAIEDKTISPAGGSKRLIITGTAIMGGVEIKN
jgi:predicted membrane protein